MFKNYDNNVAIGIERIERLKTIIENTNFSFRSSKESSGREEDYIMFALMVVDDKYFNELKDKNFYQDTNLSKEEIINKIDKEIEDYNIKKIENYNIKKLTDNINSLYDLGNKEKNIIDYSHSGGWHKYTVNLTEEESHNLKTPLFKVYLSFNDLNDMNKENISNMVNDLSDQGFKGSFKIKSETKGLGSTDLMCIYGISQKDQELAYNYFLKNEKYNLASLKCGVDVSYTSFSASLANGIYLLNLMDKTNLIDKTFIEEYNSCNNWDNTLTNGSFSENTLNENLKTILNSNDENTYRYFFKQNNMSEKIIENNEQYINSKMWSIISETCKLNENFIEKYENKVDWEKISEYQTLSETFIEKNIDKINWTNICKRQDLSLEFIEKYKDKIDWIEISKNRTLNTEEKIDKFINNIDWEAFSKHQNLSLEKIEKYENKIDFKTLSDNYFIDDKIIEKYVDKLDFQKVQNKIRSIDLIEKHVDKLDFKKYFDKYYNEYDTKLSNEFKTKHFDKLINTTYFHYNFKQYDIYNGLKYIYENSSLEKFNKTIQEIEWEKIEDYSSRKLEIVSKLKRDLDIKENNFPEYNQNISLGINNLNKLQEFINISKININDIGYHNLQESLQKIINLNKDYFDEIKNNNFYATENTSETIKEFERNADYFSICRHHLHAHEITDEIKNVINENINQIETNKENLKFSINLNKEEYENIQSQKFVYKTNAALVNFNNENIEFLLKGLQKEGFNGIIDIKTGFDEKAKNNQIEIFCLSQKDQEIAYNFLKNSELNLFNLDCNIDFDKDKDKENYSLINGKYLFDLANNNLLENSSLLEQYKDCIKWGNQLQPETIEKHHDFFVQNPQIFNKVCKYYGLSEDFIENNKAYANEEIWKSIIRHQELSPEFIEKNEDKLDWKSILKYQELSESFIEKNIDKIDFKILSENYYLDDKIIDKYANQLDWNILQENIESSYLLDKYADKIDFEKYTRFSFRHEYITDEIKEKHFDRLINTDYGIENYTAEDICNHFEKLNKYPSEEDVNNFINKINWENRMEPDNDKSYVTERIEKLIESEIEKAHREEKEKGNIDKTFNSKNIEKETDLEV